MESRNNNQGKIELNIIKGNQSLNDDFGWVPFHVIAVSSEEYGTDKDLLSTQKQSETKSWESSRTGAFPVELVIQFHYRSEINHLLISSKKDKHFPSAKFLIGDGLKGSFMDAEYRLCGQCEHVSNRPFQVKLQGIGNYLKIIFTQQPQKSSLNPFQQVSIGLLKIWGKYTNYMHKLRNHEIPLVDDKSNIDKILIGMGIPLDLMAWHDEDLREWEHSPIDEETRITLRDMMRIKDQALLNQDFEALKALTDDIKKVFDIGHLILQLMRELTFAISKEDYNDAMEIKKKLKILQQKRDAFDALYETSRYEQMVVLQRYFQQQKLFFNRPTSAQYNQHLQQMDQEAELEAQQRRRQNQLRQEQQFQQSQTMVKSEIIEELPNREQDNDRHLKGDDNADNRPWWEKVDGQDVQKSQKKGKKKKEEKKEDDSLNAQYKNPFSFNEGDRDLEQYFKHLISKTGDQIPEIPTEILRRLHHMGYLTVFGAKVWSAASSENWRLREAAVAAVLNFIEGPLPEKYLNGKSKKLFLSCMEMVKLGLDDKVLSIYFACLKLLSTALAPPVCGTDVSPKTVMKVLNEFLPNLLAKISEMNFRARDITLHTLISIFKHPAAQVGDLMKQCISICIEDPNFPTLYVPPDKQPERIMLSRLEVVLNVVQDQGIDESQWAWQDVFVYLCVPCLFHPANEVRMYAVQLIVEIYVLVGEDVRQAIKQVDMKQQLLKSIEDKMDKNKEEAKRNQENREKRMQESGIIPNQSVGHLKEILEEKPGRSSQSQREKRKKEEEKAQIEEIKKKSIIFGLDAIIGVSNTDYPYHALVSNLPDNQNQGKQLISKLAWDSPKENPNFDDDYVMIDSKYVQPSTKILVEIQNTNISKKDPKFTQLGWTIIPVFDEKNQDFYCGAFQIPLFKSPVSENIINEIQNKENPWSYLMEQAKIGKKTGVIYLEWTSIVIRLSTLARKNEIGNTFTVQQLEPYSFLPPDKIGKYKLDSAKEKKISGGKKLITILPKKTTEDEYQQQITQAILENFQIYKSEEENQV